MFKHFKESMFFVCFMSFMILYMFYKIHLGLHFDEAYLVNLGKIKMDGIRSISECWDILQMSGWILYPFTYLFHIIVGSYEGVILYFRYIYVVIHTVIAIYSYDTLKLFWSKRQAQVVSSLSFLFSFYWYTICYRSILYWGLFLSILFIIRYLSSKKSCYICLSAIAFCITVVCYPTAIIMVIPFTIFFMKCGIDKKKEISIFWVTCCICAAMVVIGLLMESGPKLLFDTVKYTISYESSENIHKIITCAEILAFLIFGEMVYTIYNKFRIKFKFIKNYYYLVTEAVCFFLIVIIAVRPLSAGVSRFWYAFILLFALLLPAFRRNENINQHKIIKYLFVYSSIWLLFIISLSVANGLAIAAYGGIFGLMGFLLFLFEKQNEEKSSKFLGYGLLVLFLFCFLFFVPDNDLGASNIFWDRSKIEAGPGKGINVTKGTLDKYEEICEIVEKNVNRRDQLFILSDAFRSYGFMNTDAKQVSHWAYIVYPDSERIVEYFESFIYLNPTVVIVNKSFVEEFYNTYDAWINGSALGEYISSNYNQVAIIDEWIIYR